MHSVKIATKFTDGFGPQTDVWIDGKKFEGLVAVEYSAAVSELHKVSLTFYAGEVEIADPC